MAEDPRKIIGRGSATDKNANTSNEFNFWLAPEVLANPFDIVEAETYRDSKTYGLVLNLEHTTDAASHLSNYISNNFGEATEDPQTPRQGTTVAKCAVLSNTEEIYMPVPSEARIRFADAQGILKALGADAIKEEHKIPAGLIEMSNGTQAPCFLDARYLLGPEGAHLNVSGISGLATKTSYVVFLISAILQKYANAESTAVVLLNVKHDDLLHIHEPNEELKEPDRKMWNNLALEPKAFPKDRVHYLLPNGKLTASTGKPNSHSTPNIPHDIYAYALSNTRDKVDLLMGHVPDVWDTLRALIGIVQEGLAAGVKDKRWGTVKTWSGLIDGPPLYEVSEGKQKGIGEVPASTVNRFRRILRRITQTRQSGLFVDQLSRNTCDLGQKIKEIKGGHTYVVDIYNLKDEEKTLVFGDILRTIYQLYAESDEEDQDMPDKVIIFVDELNKYAPEGTKGSPILDQVLEVSERGRSLGIVLFGAEQFLSAVHDRVTGNCSTTVFGRTNAAEMAERAYRFLNPDIKAAATRLDKGQLILSHAVFRQPVKIKFPLPAYKQPA
ncbi:MAG TPA: ATP-binding protein [Terriglobia bacterium]|nr:ATP-binding protein [Terriglobia bacterium]